MRWLGLDLGAKTIGVAVCDEDETVASPVRTLPRVGGQRDLAAVVAMLAEYEAQGVVLGLPIDLRGRETDGSTRARRFGASLAQAIDGPVEYTDERFSTVEAERALLEADLRRSKRRQVVNHVAAALILQAFIDRRRAHPEDS